jgi:hypothetical protein
MPKYWNHVEIKKFLPPLFMTFLDVSSLNTIKQKKLFPSVCGSVYLYISLWFKNLCNSIAMNWSAHELCSVTVFSLLVTFKWIDMCITFKGLIQVKWCITCLGSINQGHHKWRQKGQHASFLKVFHNFLTFDGVLADWHEKKLCRPCYIER